MKNQVAAGILAVLLFANPFFAPVWADDGPARVISMTGKGHAAIEPDMATLSAGVTSEAKTARAALDANTAKMTAVIEEFKAAGIPEKDLRTSNFSVQPRYFHERTGNEPPRIVGYTVQNQITATIRDLSILGPVLDASVTMGANMISGPNFDVADRTAALDEARRHAAADALRKARLYADVLGITLGPVHHISETTSVAGPRPMFRAAMAAMDESAPIAIEAGNIDLTAQINISWQIAE